MKLFLSFCIIIICFAECNEIPSAYTNRISKNDIGLEKPQPSDWLYEHKETGQTFQQYRNASPVKPRAQRSKIYLQPIGNFEDIQRDQIELIREYLQIYFQLPTEILPAASDDRIPDTDRRIREDNSEQLHAPYILDNILKKNIPDSAIVVMGITSKDLYPKPEWNFVFGLAYLKQRVGVSSLYRMQENKLNAQNFNLSLERILKISSHEIGHMFSIQHCTYAKCIMNGANHLQETDNSPIRLCSVCQQKLQYSLGYNDERRLEELINFFRQNNLRDNALLLQKDL